MMIPPYGFFGALLSLSLTMTASAEGLRIASWNIEHLAAENEQGCEPRNDSDYARLAQVIDKVDADIWLLQEIENADALARVFTNGDWIFHVEGRPAVDRNSPCWGRDDGKMLRMQATAIAVRAEVVHDRLPDIDALDIDGRGFLRWGTSIRLPDHGGLELLNVHLKSRCFEGDRSPDCAILFSQLPVLVDWMNARSGVPAIVGGDINRRLEMMGDPFWLRLDDRTTDPLSIAGAGVTPRCFARFTEFIDFFVLNDAAHKMKSPGSFAEVRFTQGPPASDHCPIVIEIAD